MEGFVLQKNDMPEKYYTLAGRRGFVHRYADTGFKTKWCGVWFPPYKFFEYFAYNINGEWLSPQDADRLVLKKGEASHIFKLKDFEAEESLFVPKKLPAAISLIIVRNISKEKKNVTVAVEAAVNIRTKAENLHQRTYETSYSDIRRAVAVKSGGNYAVFGAGKIQKNADVVFEKNESYKEHKPGGDLQRCFLPGKYSVSFELGAGEAIEIPFIFSGSSGAADIFAGYDAAFTNWKNLDVSENLREKASMHPHIVTPDKEINDAYTFSIRNMQSLVHDAGFGTGMFAGYPWFLEFWGRDTFWSIRGMIDAGDFEDAKNIIRTLAEFQGKRMPCVVNLDKTVLYHGADVDALFLIALDYYVAFTGDTAFENELAGKVKSALDALVLVNHLVQHAGQETWMDSISRSQTAVEIQSFWIEAIRKREPELAKKMHEKLIYHFWDSEAGYFYDAGGNVRSPKRTANGLFPLVFGQLPVRDAGKALDLAKKELASPFGVRTLSKNDKDYSPSAYHKGAAWGFTTAIAACSALNYGRVDDGLGYLKILAADAKKHLGGMSECLNADTGELLGCGMQLWSSALFVHAIDLYLFGISYNSLEKKLVIAPLVPPEWKFMERKNKKAGNAVFDVSVVRTKKGYELDVNFHVAPDGVKTLIFVPEGVKSALINGKKVKPAGEQSVEFAAGKVNTIVIEVLEH